jgi:hypothetical protein
MGNAIRRGGSIAMNKKQAPHVRSGGVKRTWNTEEATRILTSSRRTETETEMETETKIKIQSPAQNHPHDELKNKRTEENVTNSEDSTYLERLQRFVSQSQMREYVPQGAFATREEQLEYLRQYYPTWYEFYQARMQLSQTSSTQSSSSSSSSTTTTTTSFPSVTGIQPSFTRLTPGLTRDRSRVSRRDVASDIVKGRLTGPQLQQLLSLHYRNPQQHTASFLAERFQMNIDDVAQLLRWIRLPKKYKYENPKTQPSREKRDDNVL